MDVHQSGTREDRYLYAYAFAEREAWQGLDQKLRFDYALLDGRPVPGDRLLDFLDADTSWTLVFRDDAAALFVRRSGPLRAVAERHGYRLVPAGDEEVPALARAVREDPEARAQALREIDRQIAASPQHARPLSILATLEWMEGDAAQAREHLVAALAVDPRAPGAHQRLGMIALAENRPGDAVRELEAERALGYGLAGLDELLGRAYQRAGDPPRAIAAYRRELRVDPGNVAARDSLAALEPRGNR
jgi:tetratricopeptide (TPR) repeat protein